MIKEGEIGTLLRDINVVLKGRAFICGGAIRSLFEGKTPKDIDIFLKDAVYLEEVLKDLSYLNVFKIRTSSGVAYEMLYKGVVLSVIKPQYINGRYTCGSLEDIIKGIDFNVCRLGIAENGNIVSIEPLEEIIKAIEDKELIIVNHRPEEKNRVLRRVAKYKTYGYKLKEEHENNYINKR